MKDGMVVYRNPQEKIFYEETLPWLYEHWWQVSVGILAVCALAVVWDVFWNQRKRRKK